MKKDQDGFINFTGLDPVVEGVIGEGRQRQARRRSPAQQRKAEESKARKAARDAARNRRMIDPPEDLEEQLEKMAAALSVPFSSLVVFLLDRALESTDQSEVEAHREPTRSMRYEFVLPRAGKESKSIRRLR